MKFSEGLIDGVKEFEGLYLKPYFCPTGHLTIGYGHLCGKNQREITEAEADRLLIEDLNYAAQCVLASSPILASEPQCRLEALASWAFNLGVNAYKGSTLKKRVDAGLWDAAAEEIVRWVYGTVDGGKKKLPGLVRRRAWEAQVFITGDYRL
nr:MAG TPA: lysozyme [Caudoviricetes sp.]